jgi:hypothetical protein
MCFSPPAIALARARCTGIGRLFLLSGLIVAAPAIAASRDGDDAPAVGNGLLQTPIVEGRAWTLIGSVGTLYDTNFRRTPVAEAAVRLTPLLHVGAGLPVGRQQLFFGADIGRDIVINQPEFSRGRYAVGGGLEWRLGSRCSGLVGAEALQRLTLISDQAQLTNNVQTTGVVAGSASCITATGFGFGGSVEHVAISNDLAQRKPYNLRSTVFAPNLSYGTPNLGQFSLTATFNSTVYPNRTALTSSGLVDEGIHIFNGRFGYQRTLGARLQLAVGLSYLKSSPRPTSILGIVNGQIVSVPRDSFSGSGYDGSLTYHPSSRMTLGLEASRNVTVSPNVGAQFVIRNTYGADVNYAIGPSLDLNFGGRILRNQYKRSFTSSGEIARNADNVKRVYVVLDYSPVPLYSLAFEIAHQWRRSDPVDFNFDSTTARLNLRVKLGRG